MLYDQEQTGFSSARRISGEFVSVNDRTVVLVEGLFALGEPLQSYGDYRVYIEQPDHQKRYECRIKRDLDERGFSLEVARMRWHKFAEPGYREFIDPRNNRNVTIDLWIQNIY